MDTLEQTQAERTVEFVQGLRWEDIPDDVRQTAKELILDSIGVALAATQYGFAKGACRATQWMDGEPGQSSVVGYGKGFSLRGSADLHGVLFHGLDFDDSHLEAIAHPSAPVLSALLPLGERLNTSGKDVLTAYVGAVEVLCRMGAASDGKLHANGYHPTGVLGAFAAAHAAARLLGLTQDAAVVAQGLAATKAAGTLQFLNDGSWSKRGHAGWAAVAGISAATFAQAGWTAPADSYEGPRGFFDTHVGHGIHGIESSDLDSLGRTWEVRSVEVKPYPACHFTHEFIRSAMRIVKHHNVAASEIVAVKCKASDVGADVVLNPIGQKRAPATTYGAQFSLPFVLAASITRGRFTLEELDERLLVDDEVLALAGKVERMPLNGETVEKFAGDLTLVLADGTEIASRDTPQLDEVGGPEEVRAKFLANAEPVLGDARARELMDLVLELDSQASVRTLLDVSSGSRQLAER